MKRKKHPDIQIGDVFGKLTVVALDKPSKRSIERMWLCRCECGNMKSANDARLKIGHVKSCGCFMSQRIRETQTTHGQTKTPLYAVWRGIKARCNNPRHKAYARYGGRGITVCEEWNNSFETFKDWAYANGYSQELSIDRIDNDKGYSPDNCRWADVYTQANNMSHNITFCYNGETHTVAEWARILNVGYGALKKRVKEGWNVDDVVNKPYKKHKSHKKHKLDEVAHEET